MAISEITRQEVNGTGPMFEVEYEGHVKDMGKNFGDFFKKLRTNGLKPSGKMMCTYLTDPDLVPDDKWKYKIAVEVNKETEATVRYPHHFALKLTVTGSYKQFSDAYTKMGNFIEANDIKVVAPPYEVYVSGPKLGFIPVGLVSEVCFPVE